MFNDTLHPERPKWIAYPTIGYAPETSWELGVSSVLVYYAKRDTSNRLSEASGFGFVTLEGQFGAKIEHALYSNENKWLSIGLIKMQSYPLSFYGIGTSISQEPLGIANANFLIVRERLLNQVKGDWYLGLELDYQGLSNVNFDWAGRPYSGEILGKDGYTNLGLGGGLIYDSRHNVLNVRNGALFEIGYLIYRPTWGSTNRINTLFLDNRYFWKTSKKNVFAIQGVGQFSDGAVPFNQLSMIGGEMMMRGYYLGKYRDRNMFAVQAEHRWLPFKFSKRFGGAIFASVGSVAPNLNFDKLLWSAGAGLRVLLFPKRDVFSRLDLALNPNGYGIYFFIGEAF